MIRVDSHSQVRLSKVPPFILYLYCPLLIKFSPFLEFWQYLKRVFIDRVLIIAYPYGWLSGSEAALKVLTALACRKSQNMQSKVNFSFFSSFYTFIVYLWLNLACFWSLGCNLREFSLIIYWLSYIVDFQFYARRKNITLSGLKKILLKGSRSTHVIDTQKPGCDSQGKNIKVKVNKLFIDNWHKCL